MGAEFLQQHIPRRQRLVHTLALGDVDADRQMPDPKPLLVEHRGGEHVHWQMTAIAAHQRPLARFMAADFAALNQHRVASRNAFAVTRAQLRRTCGEFSRQMQVFQGHVADNVSAAVTEHLLGAGIKGADHPAQVGGDDCHLRRRVEHTAQLTMGAAQFLFAGVQFLGALLDHAHRALTLTDQHIQQRTE